MNDKSVYFKALIQRQKKSNISIEAFCRDNNVGSGQFHYWKQKLNSEFKNNESTELPDKYLVLVPLTIEANMDVKDYSPEVIYPNGVTLKLGQSLSKEELISFITLLD